MLKHVHGKVLGHMHDKVIEPGPFTPGVKLQQVRIADLSCVAGTHLHVQTMVELACDRYRKPSDWGLIQEVATAHPDFPIIGKYLLQQQQQEAAVRIPQSGYDPLPSMHAPCSPLPKQPLLQTSRLLLQGCFHAL